MNLRALTFLTVFAAIGFAALIVLSEVYLAQGKGILDGRFAGYNADDVRTYLGVLPQNALEYYVGTFGLLDTVVPVLIAASLGGLIWTYGRGIARGLVGLAPVYLGFDLSENALTREILTAGADQINADRVELASNLTQGKWLFILSLTGSAIVVWRKHRSPS